MFRLHLALSLTIIYLFTSQIGIANAEEKYINVNVNIKVLKEISSWDKNIIFLTSAKKPIQDLNDISKRHGEVGVWGGELYVPVLKLLDLAGLKVYASEKKGDKSWKVPFSIIGNAYYADLFNNKPNLLLFVTDIDSAKSIVDNGGGIRIKFKSNK
jgi:hypothetical protein